MNYSLHSLSRRITCCGLLSALALLPALSVRATDGTWGTATSGADWDTAGNWTSSTKPNSVGIATFNSTVNGAGLVANALADQSIKSITFDLGVNSLTIGSTGGNKLLLTNNGTIQLASTMTGLNVTETINSPLVIGSAATNTAYSFANNATDAGSSLVIGGAVSGGTTGTVTLTLTGTNASTNTVSGLISNGTATPLSISKNGTATTWLLSNNSNSFTGAVSILQGTLATTSVGMSGSNSALGTNGTINFGNSSISGTLNYVGAGETSDKVINLNGTSTGGAVIDTTGATGGLILTSDFTVSGGTSAKTVVLTGNTTGNMIKGKIVDGTAATKVTKSGTGTWTFTAANSYTGITTVQQGTLALDFSVSGAPVNNIVNSSSTLNMGITSSATTLSATAATLSITGTTGGDSQTFNGSSFLSGASHLNLTAGPTGTLTVSLGTLNASSHAIGQTLDITEGANTVVSTTSTNTNNAALITVNGVDFGTIDGSSHIVALSAGSYTNSTATTLGTANQVVDMVTNTSFNSGAQTKIAALRFNNATDTTLTLASGTQVAVTGGTAAPTGLSGGILVTSNMGSHNAVITGGLLEGNSNRDIVFIQNNTSGNLEVDSVITESSTGIGGLTKSGAGKLILTANNAYQNASIINEGTVVVTGNYVAASSQTLTASGTSLTGVSTAGLFVGERVTGTNIAASGSLYITAISGTTVTLSGTTVGGSNTVTFLGAGGLGVNSGVGAVQIANGATVQLGNGGASGSLEAGAGIINNGTFVFNGSGETSFNHVITGTGALTKMGSDTVTLTGTGANTYTGLTSVNDGELDLGKTSAIAVAGNLAVGDGTGAADSATLKLLSSNQIATTSAVSMNSDGRLALNGFNNTIASLNSAGGHITGSGTLTVSNGPSFTGSGNNIDTGVVVSSVKGATLAASGGLTVNGTLSTTLSVGAGAALRGTGTVGATTVALGGSVTPATVGTVGTLTVSGNLSLTSSVLNFDLNTATTAGSGVNDLIALSGAPTLTLSGTTTINYSALTSLTTGTAYTLINGASSITGFNAANFTSTGLGGLTATYSTSGGALLVTFTTPTSSTTYTVTTTAGATYLHTGGTTTLTTTITNTGTGTADTLNYTGLGASAGSGTVNNGTTNGGPLANAGGSGSNSGQTYTAGGTGGAVTITPTVSSATNATIGGSATNGGTTSATVNVYSGQSTWASTGSGSWGTITGTGSSAFGSNWGTNQGSPGLDPSFTGTDTATFSGSITGNATVNLDGASPNVKSMTFNNAVNSYIIATGSGGSLNLDNGAGTANVTDSAGMHAISADIVLHSNTAISTTNSSDKLTFSGNISETGGAKSVTVNGPGTVMVSGSNSYTGNTSLNGGTFYANGSSSTGSGDVTVTNAGTTLSGTGTIQLGTGKTLSVTNGGILTPGGVQSAPSPTAVANGSLTVTTATNAKVSFDTAGLTFALGASGSSSKLVLGTNPITVSFANSNVVTINDLVGSNLTIGTEYVLIDGDATNTTYSGLVLGSVVVGKGTLIIGGLSLLPSHTVGNDFSNLFAGSQLYLNNGDIVVDVVPEPSTYGMLAASFLALVLLQRRKRKAE